MIYYLDANSNNPYYNLAFEEYFFENKPKNDTYLMLWQNEKSVIIGRYQNVYEEVNINYAKKNNINIVRRNSGGGAVYHDLGNLNYSVITDFNSNNDIKKFSLPVIQALKELGIEVYFKGRNDIFYKNFKISGNAQYIKDNKMLHHGTLLIQSDLSVLSNVLIPKVKFSDSCSIPSIKTEVCNLNYKSDKKLTIDDIKDKIIKNFPVDKEYFPSQSELSEVKTLFETKYKTVQWNYNKMPEFNFSNKKRFKFGLVEVNCLIENCIIKDIKFSGDFFALGDLEELEKSIIGETLTNLHKFNFENYIKGITNGEILSLFEVFNLNI